MLKRSKYFRFYDLDFSWLFLTDLTWLFWKFSVIFATKLSHQMSRCIVNLAIFTQIILHLPKIFHISKILHLPKRALWRTFWGWSDLCGICPNTKLFFISADQIWRVLRFIWHFIDSFQHFTQIPNLKSVFQRKYSEPLARFEPRTTAWQPSILPML